MNIAKLKDKLINDVEKVQKILEFVECGKIKYSPRSNEIRCAYDDDPSSNGTSIKINMNTMYCVNYSDKFSFRGDILVLVQKLTDCTLREAIKKICEATGIEYKDGKDDEEVLPFGGYYKGLYKHKNNDIELETYPESVLREYEDIGSVRFENDGINLKVQTDFNIMYDVYSNRIVVPWRNDKGIVVGIMGRYGANEKHCIENDISKWYPLIAFQKSGALYGFYENYGSIMNKKVVRIGESEKFVLQLKSMQKVITNYETGEVYIDIHDTGVAVGTHYITPHQKKMIQCCYPDEIVICFDEGVGEDHLIKTANSLKYFQGIHKPKIGYIYDEENKYMLKGSKCSPSDMGREVFDKLLNECVKWIDD